MPSLTVDSIRVLGDGRVRVVAGKVERLYPSLAALKTDVRASLTRDDMLNLALALAVTRQPALGNPAVFDGKTVTVDFTLANWGTVI